MYRPIREEEQVELFTVAESLLVEWLEDLALCFYTH